MSIAFLVANLLSHLVGICAPPLRLPPEAADMRMRGDLLCFTISGLHNSIAASVGATTTTFGLTDSVEDGWGDKP